LRCRRGRPGWLRSPGCHLIAGTRLTPDDAYRFAKGETVMVSGMEHNIVKPLDFAAVTDHAEFIG
jgi:hypothetical protein